MKSNILFSLSNKIGDEARAAILETMDAHGAESLNVGEYRREFDFPESFTFFDVDKNGFGMAMELDAVCCTDKGIECVFYENSSDLHIKTPFDTIFNNDEKIYVLKMVEECFELVDNGQAPLLAEGECYDPDCGAY